MGASRSQNRVLFYRSYHSSAPKISKGEHRMKNHQSATLLAVDARRAIGLDSNLFTASMTAAHDLSVSTLGRSTAQRNPLVRCGYLFVRMLQVSKCVVNLAL